MRYTFRIEVEVETKDGYERNVRSMMRGTANSAVERITNDLHSMPDESVVLVEIRTEFTGESPSDL